MKIQQQPHTRRRSPISGSGTDNEVLAETGKNLSPITPIESGSSHDSEPPEDRPERSTPHHLPHGYTEEELAAFIEDDETEEGQLDRLFRLLDSLETGEEK